MKTNALIIGSLALAISFSACQNKSSETNTDHSTMDMGSDSSNMNMDSTMMSSGMMGAMDKMMKDMHQMKMTGNADYDLISMLRSHHQGAIAMSEAELKSGTEPGLKKIAQNIIDKQSEEIKKLDELLGRTNKSEKNYDPANKDTGLGKDMDNMMKMPGMDHNSSGSIDHEFASMMIKHHKNGIDMGNIIIKNSKMNEFRSLAQKMIEDQTKEISELEQAMSSH